MRAGRRIDVLVIAIVVAASPLAAEVRYYQDQNGVTWREETSKVQRPVRELEMETRQQQVYRQQDTTSVQQYQYLTYSPVVQYQWVPRVHDWWRIFQEPYVAYHLEPSVTWQPRPYQISVPTTQRQWIPETRTVQVPVARLKMVEQEQTTRTAVQADPRWLAGQTPPAPPASSGALATAPSPTYLPAPQVTSQYGGIARLDDGLPRVGMAERWHTLR
jgi:hypothetical protein